jgi:hypothetical protein
MESPGAIKKEGKRESEREREKERGEERDSTFKRNDSCLGTFKLSSLTIDAS